MLYDELKKATYEEYLQLCMKESENKYEYLDGYIHLQASPTPEHGRLQAELARILGNYFVDRRCGVYTEIGLTTLIDNEKDKIHQDFRPDLMVVCDKQFKHGKYVGVPSIIVEIVSPSSRKRDYFLKSNLYNQIGVKEYLIVDYTDKKIVVYHNDYPRFDVMTYKEDVYRSKYFRDLEINVTKLFNIL